MINIIYEKRLSDFHFCFSFYSSLLLKVALAFIVGSYDKSLMIFIILKLLWIIASANYYYYYYYF